MFGNFLFQGLGNTIYLMPFIFLLWGTVLMIIPRRSLFVALLGGMSFLLGVSGIFSIFDTVFLTGGKVGRTLTAFFSGLFGDLVASFIFLVFGGLGVVAFGHLLSLYIVQKKERQDAIGTVRKVGALPRFRVSKIEKEAVLPKKGLKLEELEQKTVSQKSRVFKFNPPPLNFLSPEKEKAHSGDIKQNRIIIQKTLENFGIEVVMGEVLDDDLAASLARSFSDGHAGPEAGAQLLLEMADLCGLVFGRAS